MISTDFAQFLHVVPVVQSKNTDFWYWANRPFIQISPSKNKNLKASKSQSQRTVYWRPRDYVFRQFDIFIFTRVLLFKFTVPNIQNNNILSERVNLQFIIIRCGCDYQFLTYITFVNILLRPSVALDAQAHSNII